jgi:integrase
MSENAILAVLRRMG